MRACVRACVHARVCVVRRPARACAMCACAPMGSGKTVCYPSRQRGLSRPSKLVSSRFRPEVDPRHVVQVRSGNCEPRIQVVPRSRSVKDNASQLAFNHAKPCRGLKRGLERGVSPCPASRPSCAHSMWVHQDGTRPPPHQLPSVISQSIPPFPLLSHSYDPPPLLTVKSFFSRSVKSACRRSRAHTRARTHTQHGQRDRHILTVVKVYLEGGRERGRERGRGGGEEWKREGGREGEGGRGRVREGKGKGEGGREGERMFEHRAALRLSMKSGQCHARARIQARTHAPDRCSSGQA